MSDDDVTRQVFADWCEEKGALELAAILRAGDFPRFDKAEGAEFTLVVRNDSGRVTELRGRGTVEIVTKPANIIDASERVTRFDLDTQTEIRIECGRVCRTFRSLEFNIEVQEAPDSLTDSATDGEESKGVRG